MKTRNSRAFCILFAAWVFFGIINSGVAQEQGLKNTDTARRLIVKVEGENSTDFGSGIIVGERAGYLFIVTAKHLRGGELKRTERFNVTFEFTRALLPMKAEFVEDDPNRDLTIPRVNGEKLTEQREESNPLYQNRYTGIDKLHTGDAVYPIGIPLGSEWFIPTIPWKVQKVVGENIYIDYSCQKGLSGGGLFNGNGILIGMITKTDGISCEALSFRSIQESVVDMIGSEAIDIKSEGWPLAAKIALVVGVALPPSICISTDICNRRPDPDNDDPTSVSLDSPSNGSTTSLTVTFRWHIDNPQEGETYSSTIFTDKGQDPFDGSYEDKFEAGNQTQFTRTLDKARYHEMIITWGVEVKDSQGNSYRSSLRV